MRLGGEWLILWYLFCLHMARPVGLTWHQSGWSNRLKNKRKFIINPTGLTSAMWRCCAKAQFVLVNSFPPSRSQPSCHLWGVFHHSSVIHIRVPQSTLYSQCITPCLYHQPAYPCWRCRGWYSPSRNSNLLKWLVSRNEIVRAHTRGRHYHQFVSQPVCRAALWSPALHLSGSHSRAPLRKERRGAEWVGGFLRLQLTRDRQ